MKLLLFACIWFFSVGTLLVGSVGLLQVYADTNPEFLTAIEGNNESVLGTFITQSEPSYDLNPVFEAGDARAQLVANFLERHNSPLTPYDEYGTKLVAIADQYGIDFRLLPAIAMQESNLCKAIPPGSYNCLGFGIHERGTLGFQNYEAGFDRAARELKRNYIDIGLTTPEEIMTKYTPSSNGSWAASVNQWMAEMRFDDRGKGRTEKTNADLLEFVDEQQAIPLP